MDSRDIDEIYCTIPLNEIPWNSETPPDILVKLVESGKLLPCKAIDLGCGAGNYALYLASRGFEQTGVDKSSKAIELARENAKRMGIRCTFSVVDLLDDQWEISGPFDFAYDWEVLHHIFPEQRDSYVRNVHSLLNPGGTYLSVCFSETSTQFGGTGKRRWTPLGTELYFSSEDELRDLFSRYFTVLDLKIIRIAGKHGYHDAVYAFMRKSGEDPLHQ